MLWRDHKRMAVAMARAFGLEEYEDALVKGSVEPDEKRTLVHTWPKAKRTSRRYLYRARKAFLKGKKKKCARLLGIVSHFIADGMVHETIDTYHRAKEHSRIEDELGDLAEIKALPMIDPAREGLADGEFVFAEIDALVRDGLDSEKLARALSLLGSAVLAPAQPPPDLIESRRDFIRKINKIDFRIMAAAAAAGAAAGYLIFADPAWALLLAYLPLLFGKPAIFRLLSRYGWITVPVVLGLALHQFSWERILLAVLLAAASIFLFSVPDLSRLSEKWYRIEED